MNSARTPSRRVLLVADRRPGSPEVRAAAVRRFRLARLRLDGPPPALNKRV